MIVNASVLSKWEKPWGLDVTISYTCPHCGETVIETISLEKGMDNYGVCIEDHQCYECGEYIDLEIDL